MKNFEFIKNLNKHEQEKDYLVSQLGSLLHDKWRESRKKEDGTFESRIKKTNDKVWSEKNGIDEVDIANTEYVNLPEDWQSENKKSAEVALEEINKAVTNGQEFNDNFIEQASAIIHENWLERNKNWATNEQNIPYDELSEEEKEKDRIIIKKAIEIFNSNK